MRYPRRQVGATVEKRGRWPHHLMQEPGLNHFLSNTETAGRRDVILLVPFRSCLLVCPFILTVGFKKRQREIHFVCLAGLAPGLTTCLAPSRAEFELTGHPSLVRHTPPPFVLLVCYSAQFSFHCSACLLLSPAWNERPESWLSDLAGFIGDCQCCIGVPQ